MRFFIFRPPSVFFKKRLTFVAKFIHMGQFATLEVFAQFKKATFYTVRFEEDKMSETDKFFNRFRGNIERREQLREMAAFIEEVGNVYGAKAWLFRDESAAEALPPEYRTAIRNGLVQFLDYDLRLFCIRLNDGIVILLNGGIKTTQKVNDSPDLFSKFRLAHQISRKTTEKIIDREWFVKALTLEGEEFEFEL